MTPSSGFAADGFSLLFKVEEQGALVVILWHDVTVTSFDLNNKDVITIYTCVVKTPAPLSSFTRFFFV